MATHVLRTAVALSLLIVASVHVLGFSSALHADDAAASGPPYPVTVSGLSSGGFFAVQVHVALSSLIKGAAVFAGGPYYCAMENVVTAQTICMKGPISELYVAGLESATRLAESVGTIDRLDNLEDSNVYVYAGAKDSIVKTVVGKSLEQYYNRMMGSSSGGSLTTEYDVPSEHCFPTADTGHGCDEFKSPYICNCGYDGAGKALEAVLGRGYNLRPRVDSVSKDHLYMFDQRKFVVDGLAQTYSLAKTGYAFIPPACDWQNGGAKTDSSLGCPIHIVFHGCLQSVGLVGDAMIMGSGFNNWAMSNDIIVIYPQTSKMDELLLNPKGCWDWWSYSTGYTPAYVTRAAPQIFFVENMAHAFINQSVALQPADL